MKKIVIILAAAAAIAATLVFISHKQPQPAGHPAVSEDKNKPLYYTCGMHPSVHISPDAYARGQTKCPICSMDLIPVTGKKPETAAMNDMGNMVMISPREKSLAGITAVPVGMQELFKEIKTSGVVAYDTAFRSAQQEYIEARIAYDQALNSQFADARERAKEVLDAARTKLKLFGVDEQQLQDIYAGGKADDSLILPEDTMWVYADIYEYESLWPRSGDKAGIVSPADPSRIFTGEIKAIEPVLKENTRTFRARIYVANQEGILKPNMFVDVYLKSDIGLSLAIPRDAVLDTGKRRLVYIDMGNQGYMPREVITGPEATAVVDGQKIAVYPVIKGLKEGEIVVTRGNFLIDSQSQLGAASSAYSGSLDHGGHNH